MKWVCSAQAAWANVNMFCISDKALVLGLPYHIFDQRFRVIDIHSHAGDELAERRTQIITFKFNYIWMLRV